MDAAASPWSPCQRDEGEQAGGGDDAAERPSVPGERGAAVAERDRLQSGEPVAAARTAETDRHLAPDEPTAPPDEDGWPSRETRALLLVAAGGRTPDADSVRGDPTTACCPAWTRRVSKHCGCRQVERRGRTGV